MHLSESPRDSPLSFPGLSGYDHQNAGVYATLPCWKVSHCSMLFPHPLAINHCAANDVAANMHVSCSRSCTLSRICVSGVGRMRCMHTARCLIRPGKGRTSWNGSATKCNAALVAAEPAAIVRNLATGPDKPKGKRWENVDKWVMFSDLHVSVKTLNVCISVLRRIKKEAVARKAGILFLGNAINQTAWVMLSCTLVLLLPECTVPE